MSVVLAALAVAAVISALVATRAQQWSRDAVQMHEMLQAAAATAEPLPRSSAGPLLEHPERCQAWIVTTGDGICTLLSDGARELLGIAPTLPAEHAVLPALLRDGEATLGEVLAALRERSLAPARRAQAVANPQRALELAGVALRDRGGNLWGAALLIRPWPNLDS